MRYGRQTIATAIGLMGLLLNVGAVTAQTLSSTLRGEAEVPGPGDEAGYGVVSVVPNPDGGYLCYSLYSSLGEPATAAHIHKGTAEESGPVVVPFETPSDKTSSGCVDAEQSIVQDIQANPSGYYVNVHNEAYPDGAIRAQVAP